MNNNIKKQDIPVIAGIILEAFIRNKTDFEDFSSMFGGSFESDVRDAIKEVIDRRRPIDVVGKMKITTKKVYAKLDEIQEMLRLIGEYVKIAEEDLLTSYEDYHIIEARIDIRRKNVEGVLEHCEIVLDKVITDDTTALSAVGFTAAKIAEFEAMLVALRDLNRDQVHKLNERQDIKKEEDILFNTLFELVNKISSVGKAIYTYKDTQKYSDFSVNKILGQINHGRKVIKEGSEDNSESAPIYDVMIGRVTDKTNDAPLENVVVRIEGTSIIVDTDIDGEFYIDEIPAGVYSVSFSKDGYVVGKHHNIEIGTSEMVELDVELIPDSLNKSESAA